MARKGKGKKTKSRVSMRAAFTSILHQMHGHVEYSLRRRFLRCDIRRWWRRRLPRTSHRRLPYLLIKTPPLMTSDRPRINVKLQSPGPQSDRNRGLQQTLIPWLVLERMPVIQHLEAACSRKREHAAVGPGGMPCPYQAGRQRRMRSSSSPLMMSRAARMKGVL